MKGSIYSVLCEGKSILDMRRERESFRRCKGHVDLLGPHGVESVDGGAPAQLPPKVGLSKANSPKSKNERSGVAGSAWAGASSEGGGQGLTLGGVGVVGR